MPAGCTIECIVPTHSSSPARHRSVMILSPNERIRASLLAILAEDAWRVHQVANHVEAIALLERRNIPVAIVDGWWHEILEAAAAFHKHPSVIVTVPFADEMLWAEVLNLGGYDVLAQPFDVNEVTRIVNAGFRQSQAREHRSPTTKAAFG